MQINDRELLEWVAWFSVAVTGLFTALGAYVWRGDRERLKSVEEALSDLEARVSNNITKPEAEHLFEMAKESYHAEHSQILNQLASLRGELISILKQPWRGEERRRK